MTSRVVVPEQPRVGGGKSKIEQHAEGINRRVLRDIGNLVPTQSVERKPQNQTSRSFGAELLANEQAAEENICKKPLVVTANDLTGNGRDGAVNVAAAVPRKKETLKPKEDDVIVISLDEIESCRSGTKVMDRSSKKPNKAFTSILSARSKAACGVTEKPKDLIVDIDADDVDNELAAAEYVEDMYTYYKLTEGDGRVHDYMDSQPEINSKMRAILVDCLIEVHMKFVLTPDSLYLTVNIVDRFLSMKAVLRRELLLVGISSMLIACKYEEIWAPLVSDFIAISDNAYVREQVLLMEKAILGKLEWYLTVPTPYVFLVRYIKASIPSDKEIENMTFFFAEHGLTNYSIITQYSPSVLAASAVYAARCTLSRTPLWTETLKHHTGYSEDQLLDCAKLLVSMQCGTAESSKLKAVWRKYSRPERGAVALFPQVARGVTKKPKDLIVDIDVDDVDNELEVAEYVEDMYTYYKLTEGDGQVHDYMDSQPEINSKMRAILVDCLIEVHWKFVLTPEILYLTVNIVDRFLSIEAVPMRELQLVGISSMLIACKYEGISAPLVSDFIAISENAYVGEQVLLMEKAILGKLEWHLAVPTQYVFLVRYIKASIPSDKEIENMTFFFAEHGLTNYSAITQYSPSVLAASAVYAARCTLNRTPLWTETLKHHTGYSEDQLLDCAKLLVSMQCGTAESSKLKAVWRKYSRLERGAVALFPPARSLVSV